MVLERCGLIFANQLILELVLCSCRHIQADPGNADFGIGGDDIDDDAAAFGNFVQGVAKVVTPDIEDLNFFHLRRQITPECHRTLADTPITGTVSSLNLQPHRQLDQSIGGVCHIITDPIQRYCAVIWRVKHQAPVDFFSSVKIAVLVLVNEKSDLHRAYPDIIRYFGSKFENPLFDNCGFLFRR
ncbi:MAG: hypothetical protein ACD_75C01366G0004 [uncultured bacterium]|nr:MAG: hypothetical protein ACD_75C01366G0004 [uncultured bacterium]